MPIYEYVCQDCEQKFEKFIRSKVARVKIECPACGSNHADKAFSAFSTPGTSSAAAGSAAHSAPACGPIG